MGIFELKSKDEARLKHMLKELGELNDSLGAKYSLRADLRDLTNRSFTVGKLLQEELDKIRDKQQLLKNECDQTLQLKNRIENCLDMIAELENRFQQNENGESQYDRILAFTSDEIINDLESRKQQILDKYSELFEVDESGVIPVKKLSAQIDKIEEKYRELFEKENESGENLFEELDSKLERISDLWNEYFVEDEEGSTKSKLIDERLKKLDQFYLKVFGDEVKETTSLKQELEDRLDNLKQIEIQAKATIDLSSEAGLAGGFVIKRKEANTARLISLGVFISAVIFMFGFNIWLFDEADFKNMELYKILFKVTINAPLIWIATIANINLNRFSKLEQEYSHKEALAKSYERYRTEIEQLEKLGVKGADELKVKLLNTNLDAFKLNPAEHSNQAKPDFSILEFVKSKFEESK